MSTATGPVEPRTDPWPQHHQDHRRALDQDWEVALEAPARLSHGSIRTDPSVLLTPESQDVAAALPLFGAKVTDAVAFKSGTLQLVFETGFHLNGPADPTLEAWQVT